MCGIAGRFHPVRLPPAPGWRDRVDALLAHRGPDGHGCYEDERCELVHRRLALIDLSPTGHQPMPNEDASIHVVFNGEIYNYRALRAELHGRGHVFRGTSDTEVLVHLYEDVGERMASCLRGIFAFAVYDRPRRRLVLARDRFGVKPLFHAVHGGQWVFASEIKAIVALPGFRPELDRQACYDFLGLRYVPEPATGFANVHALRAGSTLVIEPGREHASVYHTVRAHPDAGQQLAHAVEAAATALLDAVQFQSVADVPVAALLSGGIDSSLVVAAHQRATGGPTTTFNARFPDKPFDETATALAVVRHYGTRHHTIELGDQALTADAVIELLRHFDQPFADTSLIPTYWVCRAVRDQGIICTLSGDGGDEAFGGYRLFWQINSLLQLMRLPRWAGGAAVALGDRLARWTRDWGRRLSKAARLAQAGGQDVAVLIAGLSNYLTEDEKQELVRPEARERLLPVYRHFDGHPTSRPADLEELSRSLTENQFALSLPSDMLRKVDMMSMRAGIEVRVPMLDDDIVALGLSLPHTLKTEGRTGKRVLRALATRWLPPAVARHPKHGLDIPLDVMVADDFYVAIADLLWGSGARTRPFTNSRLIEQWLARLKRARHGGSSGTVSREGVYQRLVSLLALELFLRDHDLTW
jgi:asparagine synthase (glutamine-hydrolysing)